MLKLCIALLLWQALSLHRTFAQGWNFDPRVSGIQDRMAKSVVRLVVQKDVGKWTGSGTLFCFYDSRDPSRQVHAVITTRSLVQNARCLDISLPHIDSAKPHVGNNKLFSYNSGNLLVINHPDPIVDMCAVIISREAIQIQNNWATLGYLPLDVSILADDAFYKNEKQLDPVVMIGYPDGIIDDVNLQPIFRRGVYATKPALDYKGRKEFLLDIPNHGGSAGSPIFHFDDRIYSNRTSGCANITIGSRLVLVGISFPGVNPSDSSFSVMPVSGPATSIAWVIKATRIKEISDLFFTKH